ncbi:hypothetical protein D3C72_2194440 [compost metagenome]
MVDVALGEARRVGGEGAEATGLHRGLQREGDTGGLADRHELGRAAGKEQRGHGQERNSTVHQYASCELIRD